MPPYDPDYDDSYLDQMDADLHAEVRGIMHRKATNQAAEVYAGMAKQGIKKFTPRPMPLPTVCTSVGVFVGGPKDGDIMAIRPGETRWEVADTVPMQWAVEDISSPVTVSIRRGIYERLATVIIHNVIYPAFIWKGWCR